MLKLALALFAFVFVTAPSHAAPAERRIALVVGNANYQAGALQTPANDAGLIAQTLQAAGFDVWAVAIAVNASTVTRVANSVRKRVVFLLI